MASGATPLVISTSFLVTPGCLATYRWLPEEGGTLLGLFFSGSTTLGGVSALELMEEEARMAGRQFTLSILLSIEEASTLAWLRASFHTWRQ